MRKATVAAKPRAGSEASAVGQCLCGAVEIEIGTPARWAWHDHSGATRRAHGAAYATYVGSWRKRFRVTRGADEITRFRDETGASRTPEPHEGMHQTATIDILQILEGELWCLLDSGEETCLRAGDVIVQRGTVHAWRNRSDQVTRYLAIMVTAPLPHPIEHHANP